LLRNEVVPVVYESKAQMLEAIHQLPYDFIPLNRTSWVAHEAAIYQLIGEIFGQNPGFQAISEAEFRSLYNPDFAEALCPHSSVLLADRATGDLLAISFCLPNYHPLGLRERPRFEAHYPLLQKRTLLAKTQGVHPAHRQKGLMSYLGVYGMLSFKSYYDEIIFCLMREDNPSLRFTDPFAHEKAIYASYCKDLD
jgi:hypothetical protein